MTRSILAQYHTAATPHLNRGMEMCHRQPHARPKVPYTAVRRMAHTHAGCPSDTQARPDHLSRIQLRLLSSFPPVEQEQHHRLSRSHAAGLLPTASGMGKLHRIRPPSFILIPRRSSFIVFSRRRTWHRLMSGKYREILPVKVCSHDASLASSSPLDSRCINESPG